MEDEVQHIIPITGGGHLHLTRCWDCIVGTHHDEVTLHDWADAEDIKSALIAGRPDPTGQRCGCYCAGPLEEPIKQDSEDDPLIA